MGYREQIRLRLSLEEAKKAGHKKIICMVHYPPTNEKFEDSAFINIFKEFGVNKVIYGHLHGMALKGKVLNEERDGIDYKLTSCDFINFDPIKILD